MTDQALNVILFALGWISYYAFMAVNRLSDILRELKKINKNTEP